MINHNKNKGILKAFCPDASAITINKKKDLRRLIPENATVDKTKEEIRMVKQMRDGHLDRAPRPIFGGWF